MKKCNHCNAENLDNARFCDSCGIKFEDTKATIVEEENQVIVKENIAEEVMAEEVIVEEDIVKEVEDKNQNNLEETVETPDTDEIKTEDFKEEQKSEPINTSATTFYMPNTLERKHTGLMAFSIINICSILFSVITLYMSFFSMILGIIAVITLNKAKYEPNDEYYKTQKKNALILNIVGLALGIIGFISFVGIVIYFVIMGLQGLGTIL